MVPISPMRAERIVPAIPTIACCWGSIAGQPRLIPGGIPLARTEATRLSFLAAQSAQSRRGSFALCPAPMPDALSPLPAALSVQTLVSAYTTDRTSLLLRGVISSSPASPDLSGRGYELSFAGFGGHGVNGGAAPSVFL
jgi:hypothetical protein